MKTPVQVVDLQETIRASVLEVRGDGKAGGGLVLAFQSLASLAGRNAFQGVASHV